MRQGHRGSDCSGGGAMDWIQSYRYYITAVALRSRNSIEETETPNCDSKNRSLSLFIHLFLFLELIGRLQSLESPARGFCGLRHLNFFEMGSGGATEIR